MNTKSLVGGSNLGFRLRLGGVGLMRDSNARLKVNPTLRLMVHIKGCEVFCPRGDCNGRIVASHECSIAHSHAVGAERSV